MMIIYREADLLSFQWQTDHSKLDQPPKFSTLEQYFRFLFSFRTLVDLGIIVPFYISYAVAINGQTKGQVNILKVFRVFRVFRLLSISAVFKELEYVKLMFVETLYASRRVLFILVLTAYFNLAFFGILYFFLEGGVFTVNADYPQGAYLIYNPTVQAYVPTIYSSAPAGMYFIGQTLTTDTYGDIYPTNPSGRSIVIFLMYFGVVFVSLPIGLLSNAFKDRYQKFLDKKELETQERMYIQDPGVNAAERNRRKQELIRFYRRNLRNDNTLHTHDRKEILRKLVERYVSSGGASPRAKELLLQLNARSPAYDKPPGMRYIDVPGYQSPIYDNTTRVALALENTSAVQALDEPEDDNSDHADNPTERKIESTYQPTMILHDGYVDVDSAHKPSSPNDDSDSDDGGHVTQEEKCEPIVVVHEHPTDHQSCIGSTTSTINNQKGSQESQRKGTIQITAAASALSSVSNKPMQTLGETDHDLDVSSTSSRRASTPTSAYEMINMPSSKKRISYTNQHSNSSSSGSYGKVTPLDVASKKFELVPPQFSNRVDSDEYGYKMGSFKGSIRFDDDYAVNEDIIGISNIVVLINGKSEEETIIERQSNKPPVPETLSYHSTHSEPYSNKNGMDVGHPSSESLSDTDQLTESASVNQNIIDIVIKYFDEWKAILLIHTTQQWNDTTTLAEKLFDFFDYNLFKNFICFIGAVITYGAVLLGTISYLLASVWTYQERPETCANPVCQNVTGVCENETVCQPVPLQLFNTSALTCAAILGVEFMVRLLTCWAVDEQRNHVKPYFKPDAAGDHFTVISHTHDNTTKNKGNIRSLLEQTNTIFNNFTAKLSDNAHFPLNPRYTVVEFYLRYIFSVRSMVSVTAVIPTLIILSRPYENAKYYLTWGGIFSMLCIAKIFFCSKELSWFFSLVMKTLYFARNALFLLVIINIIAAVFLGSLLYQVEKGTFTVNSTYPNGSFLTLTPNQLSTQPSVYTSLLIGIYTAFCTLTTVVYGETAPTTGFGRAIAVIIMFTGLILLALPIGIIGSSFNLVYEKDKQKRLMKAKNRN